MQLFISDLASWLRTRRFSELTFPPSGATTHWKNIVFHDVPSFSRTCIFFVLRLSLSSSLLFSDSSHLCFSSVHTVGSLTSKPPSTTTTTITALHHSCSYYIKTITTSTTLQLRLQLQHCNFNNFNNFNYINYINTTTTITTTTTTTTTALHHTTSRSCE